MRELWPTYVAGHRRGDGALFDTVLSMAEAVGLSAFGRQVRIAHGRPDRRPDLAEVRLPTLVVRGETDQLCTPDQQAEMIAAMPFAQSVTVPAAGHFAPLEAPLAMASALHDWSRMSGIAA
jgi:pimeloyl-ACP methyl ester carboxylesterase